MDSNLFRPEVAEARTRRLYGEVVLNQTGSARLIVIVLATIVLASGLWLSLGSFARIEKVRGVLNTIEPAAKVVAPVAGIVTTLAVHEGDEVNTGDKLAIITLDRRTGEGRGVTAEGIEALRARIVISETQLESETARAAGEQTRVRVALDAAREEAKHLDSQISLQEELVASQAGMLAQIGGLADQGFVSKHEYARRQQVLISARQQLNTLKQQKRASLIKAEQTLLELSVNENRNAAQLGELQSSRLALAQQEAQLRGEQAYVLTAPINGVVTAFQIARGRTAAAGAPLMTVVPKGSRLRAEIYAPSRAIGMVEIGQEARLLFDAFPYQRFGSFGGRIMAVSRTAIDPRENQTPLESEEMVYRLTVDLDSQDVQAFGKRVPLQSGMTLTANIVLERQSFVGWLFTPLRAVMRRTA